MSIGKGFIKYDDYNRFGSYIDKLEKIGVAGIYYYPKKGRLVVYTKKEKADEIKSITPYKISDVIVKGGMVWIKIDI